MSVFEYSDYKRLLSEHLTTLPKKGRGEITRLAAAIKVHPTVVSQVLRGQKDFTLEQAHGACRHFGFQPLETDYVILLVQIDRAGSADLKKYYKEKLAKTKVESLALTKRIKEHRSLSEEERAVFYSSWIYSAVRLFVSVDEGKSAEDVAQKFELPRAQTSEILGFLTRAGLCLEAGGVFTLGSQHTHLSSASPFLNRHHANWRLQALHRSDSLSEDELMFTSPFSISVKDFKRIREEVVKLVQASSLTIKDSSAEDIACLNIDLFWIGKKQAR